MSRMIEEQPQQSVAAMRVWMDERGVSLAYERSGIPIATLTVRRELAQAAIKALPELLAGGGDQERIEAITEVADMVRVVLGGGPGQVLPLTGPSGSVVDTILGLMTS